MAEELVAVASIFILRDVAVAISSLDVLFLFFSLLPDTYRSDVELIAMKCVFQESAFAAGCKGVLAVADLGRLQTATVSLLKLVWCSTGKSKMERNTIGSKHLHIWF